MEFPEGLAARVLDVHGDRGKSWLDSLPDLIRDLEGSWAIEVEVPFPDSNYNYVAAAVFAESTEAVLKLSVPGEHLAYEAKALEAYGGKGAPKLIKQDLRRGALLMERVRPGTEVSSLADKEAIAACVEVMGQLHQAPISGGQLPTVGDWGEGFDRLRMRSDSATGPLPEDLVMEAEDVFHDLAASMGSIVLLHGDLHHMNILASGPRSWVAIDPQGVIGEKAYEIGAFLRNPMPAMLDWPDLGERQQQRIALFADRTGNSRSRIARWAFSQAVLSAIWSLEDHGHGWEGAIRVARVLRDSAFA